MEYLSLFNELKARKMSLDLTRGKPARDQLDLSSSIDSVEIDIMKMINYYWEMVMIIVGF